MTIETLGIDIAKNVFQLHGVNRNGRVVLKRRVMRDQLLAVLAQIGPCTVVIEACTGAFYWAHKFEALGHQIRGLLLDRGFAIAKSITRARRAIPEILADLKNELTAVAREALSELYDLFRDLDRRIASFDKKIERIFRQSEPCQRIAKIKGVGPKTATAVIAAIGDGSEFKNGRHFAAWVGLVPRQHSSGDRKVLMGISKRGNRHLRSLLVHGARAVVRTVPSKTNLNNEWVNQLRERRGFNRATVAIANKNARIIWAVLRTGEAYRAAH